MDIRQAVAENIQRIRKSQKLSIDRAAELSGVSKSMLSQIERGCVNPTISVLSKLAQGLHVPLEKLTECGDEQNVALYRTVDAPGQRLFGGKVIRYPLCPFDTDSYCESSQLDIFISGVYTPADHIPGSRVYLTVLSGVAEVVVGEESFLLESRDSLVFSGSMDYSYTNKSNTTVRLIERIMYQK
ncbi:MAG: helix-turn-helix transcriptional regulator [Oscillospiraceae bacterium]|nr:helix-turn-helix transcriptional regulator [Oscillospiraceae bacterium]